MRHIETPTLWLQSLVSRKRIEVLKTKGTTNVADIGTKYLSGPEISRNVEALQLSVCRDVSEFALQVKCFEHMATPPEDAHCVPDTEDDAQDVT